LNEQKTDRLLSRYDIGLGGRLSAENAFGKIFEDCQSEPENLVVIGIKGGAYNTPIMHQLAKDLGVTVFTIPDVETLGMPEVVNRAIEAAGKATDRI
jgi:arginase family enzyme